MRAPPSLFSSLSPIKSPATLPGNMSKRRRVKPPLPPSTPPPPPLPPSPPPKRKAAFTSPLSKPQRSLSGSLKTADDGWELLPLPRSELSLSFTLPTGQTFRWRCTAPSRYTGVVGPYLLSLRHLGGDPSDRVAFLLHNPDSSGAARAAARVALTDYLNLGVSLADLWDRFSAADPRFAELAKRFDGGARVLRQDPVECVFQFLCSSNNNIRRIEKMVGVLSSFGEHLGAVGGFDFHEFPSLERLSLVTEQQLREAGFGYRAKYIVGAVKTLQAKPGGGAKWLASLRVLNLEEVVAALCTLPGVGPKVAACIALFSLDQHHAIPVDTHVWQIATQYLLPELAGAQLTPKLYKSISEAFVTKFGEYAGWAQNVLFIGELPSLKAPLEQSVGAISKTKPKNARRKRGTKRAAANLSSEENSMARIGDAT